MFFLNAVTEVHTFNLSGKLFHNTAHLYLTVLFLYDVFGEKICIIIILDRLLTFIYLFLVLKADS